MNVVFSCFGGRADAWAKRGNEQGAENLRRYQQMIREKDLVLTHTLINPQVDRSKPDTEAGGGLVALHKVGETPDSIIVRGARLLATLCPFSDEIAIYPGSPIRPTDHQYALNFAIPMSTPGLKFICRDSFTKERNSFDYPLSSRFDEMDAVVVFDDVHVPKERVFLDGDAVLYESVLLDSNWRSHTIHHAMIRAWTKLEFAFGIGHMLAEMIGVNGYDHIQEKLGEIWCMLEMTRSAVFAAENGGTVDEGGVFTPDQRPFVALRGLMPKWIPRAYELIQLIGGGGFMCTPSLASFNSPVGAAIDQYFQARNGSARERVQLFRLAWDFIGSELGGRNELYERFYLADSFRMTALAYVIADKENPMRLVKQFLTEPINV
jgi:4-hydroxyphenylacetate 3-monooxygenase oxygenase component